MPDSKDTSQLWLSALFRPVIGVLLGVTIGGILSLGEVLPWIWVGILLAILAAVVCLVYLSDGVLHRFLNGAAGRVETRDPEPLVNNDPPRWVLRYGGLIGCAVGLGVATFWPDFTRHLIGLL